MTNQSSPSPILCASFNQDYSGFSIGTRDGFKIFDSDSGRLCYDRAMGAFNIVEMMFGSSLLAIVGAGEQPSLSPRRLCLFNTKTGAAARELNFLTSILAVRLNMKRLIVLLQDKTYIYDLNSLAILDTIDTVPNLKGLCAFSPNLEGCYLALPASTTKGSVLLYNVMELQSHCESYSFRRGTYLSAIYSLAFGPSLQLPDILVATSSSGSVHVFSLAFMINQRSKRSSSLLGSMLPNKINDAFEPAHHYVLPNAVPAGVKSYVMIRGRGADTVAGMSPKPQVIISQTLITIITVTGYFQQYKFSIDHANNGLWSLERELNLLTAILDNVF